MIKALREFQNDLLEEIDKLKRGVDDVRQDVMTDYRREFYDEDYMEMRRFRHRMNRRGEMEDREFQVRFFNSLARLSSINSFIGDRLYFSTWSREEHSRELCE